MSHRHAMAHGRTTMPFGKYKGCRVRLLPNDYLSFLTTLPLMRSSQWRWIWDSVIAELKYRGMRYDLAETEEPKIEMPAIPEKPIRKMRIAGL